MNLKLAVIPTDPIQAYKNAGISSWLKDYYNPLQFFDKVYLLSPLEKIKRYEFGMHIIPTNPADLKRQIKQIGIDLVRAYGSYWACDMACDNKVPGVPVVVSVHDTFLRNLHDSIKKADIILCVSGAVKQHVLTKVKELDKIWILPNRVDFNVMSPKPLLKPIRLNKACDYKYRILHVGRTSNEKNLDTLIKSLAILGTGYCIVAIGKGNVTKYMKIADAHKVLEQCFFIDSVPNEELAGYYTWASCMCTPSRSEGFGIVFIEALACGAIVVTSDIAPINEYIKHMENGLLVKNYEDPQSLAEWIRIACCDQKIRKNIKQKARNSVKIFDKNNIDKLEVEYYKKVLLLKNQNMFNTAFSNS
ncbi:MAG: glycosyltransferase family 4 protein [Candidatus Omnitrophota bacterium]